MKFRIELYLMALAAFSASGCRKAMYDQAKTDTYAAQSAFMPARRDSARVARDDERDETLNTGTQDGKFLTQAPIPVSEILLERGRERFRIFCKPCHGEFGYGDGVIVQRGLAPPPSYHSARLREVPDGYLFTVIGSGLLRMPRFESRISAEDRWAITQYIRVLQLSQNAELQSIPPNEQSRLEAN